MGARGIRNCIAAISFALAAAGAAETSAQPPADETAKANVPRKQDDAGKDAVAASFTAGLVTGAPQSTEFAVVQDIAVTLATGQETGPHGEVALRVLPMVGNGGARNIADMLTLAGADMAIAPVVLVDRLRQSRSLGDLGSRIVYLAVLFPEEFHLLVKPEIRTLSDLAGKTVSLGEESGPAAVLGREVLDALGIMVRTVNLGIGEALDAMRKGEVDGALVVSAKPVDVVARYAQFGALRLLPIPYADAFRRDYRQSAITHADYPTILGVDEKVDTIATDAALFAYAWPPRNARYRLMETFVQSFLSRFPEFLKPPHHPAWLRVDLARTLPEWKRFAPAEAWLKKHENDGTVLRAPPEAETRGKPAEAPLFPDGIRQ